METALIVGAGSGLSGSLARLLASEGFRVALAARNVDKLRGFPEALLLKCDALDGSQVEDAFQAVETGYAESAPFAMGKFALRGLAQSMARELAPKNIHVAHFVIDGGIRAGEDGRAPARGEDGMLLPDEIAKSYLQVYRQHRSAWSWELELRPWVEKF
jgi:NAD(P)-dependent dehydrogenase (short-subunit alcohol dehydrogenase family)